MSVLDLWLPILLVGLATHILSTLAWTVLPHHKPEWTKMPGEEGVQDAIVGAEVPPGQYVFPFAATPNDMKDEAFLAAQGKCTGMLVIWEAPLNMGAAIGRTFAYFVVTAFCLGYLATLALAPGDSFGTVFHFTATAAILTHCFGMFPGVFWFRQKVLLNLADKLVYALVTGLLFAAMWPAA